MRSRDVGLAARRAASDVWVLAATFLTVLVSASVVMALALYAAIVPGTALSRLLQSAPERAAVLVTAPLDAAGVAAQDAFVREAAAQRFVDAPVTVQLAGASTPYLVTAPDPAVGARTEFWFLQDPDRAGYRLRSGRWPTASTGTDVEVAVDEMAAAGAGIREGSGIQLSSSTFGPDVRAVVTGVYGRGDRPEGSAVAFGPTLDPDAPGPAVGAMLVAREAFESRFAASGQLTWLITPDLAGVDADSLPVLTQQLADFRADIGSAAGFGPGSTVRTDLGGLLSDGAAAVTASRSALPVPLLLLAAVAGITVAYAGLLLATRRREQTRLLRARGATRMQVGAPTLVEAVALTAPAVLASTVIGAVLLRLGAGTAIDSGVPVPPAARWTAAGGFGVVAVLALTAPALLGAGDSGAPGRRRIPPRVQRAGVDVALLLVAALCYVQLRSGIGAAGGTPGGATASVRTDPLLVLTPVAGMAALSLLALRLLPPLARLAGGWVGLTRSASVPLGAWPVVRRPARYSGPLLLLVLALALGVFTVVAGATGAAARAAAAGHLAAGDVRVILPGPGPVGWTPARLPGAAATSAVTRDVVDVGSGPTVPILGVQAATAPAATSDAADVDPARFAALAAANATTATTEPEAVPLPPGARRIEAIARLTVRPGPDPLPDQIATAALSLAFRDDAGLVLVVPWGPVATDGAPSPLAADVPTGADALLGVLIDYSAPGPVDGTARLSLADVRTGPARLLPLGERPWSAAAGDGPSRRWQAVPPTGIGRLVVRFPVDEGNARVPVLVGRPATLGQPVQVPAVATDALLESLGVGVGASVDARLRDEPVRLRIVGSSVTLPTSLDDVGLAVDLPTLQRVVLRSTGRAVAPDEWWIRARDGQSAEVAAAVRADPAVDATVLERSRLQAEVDSDPLVVAYATSLRAALAGSVLLVMTGFGFSTVLSARERRPELSVLRALGASTRTVWRALLVEQSMVAVLGSVLGLATGLVVSALLVPLSPGAPGAAGAVSDPGVVLPWTAVAVLWTGVVLLVLGTTAAVTAVLARRRRIPDLDLDP